MRYLPKTLQNLLVIPIILITLFFSTPHILVKPAAPPVPINPVQAAAAICARTHLEDATYDPNSQTMTLSLTGPTANDDVQAGNLIVQTANHNNIPDLTSSSKTTTTSGIGFIFQVPTNVFNNNIGNSSQPSFPVDLGFDINFEPPPGSTSIVIHCPAPINQQTTMTIQTAAQPNPPQPPGGGAGSTNCQSSNSCSGAGGIPCNTDDGSLTNIPPGKVGVMTAIGCVPTEPQALISGLIKVAAGLGGAIALLLMIAGSIQMLTSGGNPEQIKKGREQFIAAGAGLLFVIFSVTLLQILGVDILAIPGFGKTP